MIEFLLIFMLRVFIGSFIIVGIWNAAEPDEIFGKPAKWMVRKFPAWVCKPLFDCVVCMASVWGTVIWFYFGGDFWWWTPFVLALSGWNRIIANKLL